MIKLLLEGRSLTTLPFPGNSLASVLLLCANDDYEPQPGSIRTSTIESLSRMKITKTSLLTIIFGMVISQVGWFVAGLALERAVYVDKWHYIPEDQAAPLRFLALLSAVLLGAGVAKGRAIARALEKEKVVRGRLLKVKEDNSGDNTAYRLTFEYFEDPGFRQSLEITRSRNELELDDEFPILIDEQTGEGLLELDLPGGTMFANFQGTQPIEPKVFLRILVIPVLAFAPLLGLVPQVAVTLEHLSDSMGWIVCAWSVVAQAIWLFANGRHFTFKAMNIGGSCKKQCKTEKVHPTQPAGGLQ